MSTPLTLPVVKVTVLEDRALIERRGEVSLSAGPQRLVVTGLSPLAVDRSLQSRVAGGTVSQCRLKRATKPPRPEAMREHLTELDRRIADLRAKRGEAARIASPVVTDANACFHRIVPGWQVAGCGLVG